MCRTGNDISAPAEADRRRPEDGQDEGREAAERGKGKGQHEPIRTIGSLLLPGERGCLKIVTSVGRRQLYESPSWRISAIPQPYACTWDIYLAPSTDKFRHRETLNGRDAALHAYQMAHDSMANKHLMAAINIFTLLLYLSLSDHSASSTGASLLIISSVARGVPEDRFEIIDCC